MGLGSWKPAAPECSAQEGAGCAGGAVLPRRLGVPGCDRYSGASGRIAGPAEPCHEAPIASRRSVPARTHRLLSQKNHNK